MGLLAAILLVVWLGGIVATAYSVVWTVKNGEGEIPDRTRLVLETNPVAFSIMLSILVVAWPATLAFSLATKRK